jgi:hypothetical protein
VSTGGGIVKQPADAPAGSRIHVRVAKGEFDARVEAPRRKGKLKG